MFVRLFLMSFIYTWACLSDQIRHSVRLCGQVLFNFALDTDSTKSTHNDSKFKFFSISFLGRNPKDKAWRNPQMSQISSHLSSP